MSTEDIRITPIRAELPEHAVTPSVSEHRVAPRGLTLLGAADAEVCVDGVCAVPGLSAFGAPAASVADVREDRAES